MKQRLRQVGTKQERVGVTMCVHVRAQCLRGRDRSCSLSAWLNKRGHERISEDRPECSSAISLVPPQNTSDRHGLQKKEKQKTKKKTKETTHTHTRQDNQKKQTQRMLRFQRDYLRNCGFWQEERNIVFVYFFTWAFHCF